MEKRPFFSNSQETPRGKFSSPEEELDYLREVVKQKEKAIEKTKENPEKEEIIRHTLKEYSGHHAEGVMQKGAAVPEAFQNEIVLELSPEEHDYKMSELLSIVESKGIISALNIVSKLNDPHIEDDFHRFLVEYLKEGYSVGDLKEGSKIFKTLGRTLFEVTLPDSQDDEQNLGELVALMEQFYSGMLSVSEGDKDDYVTLEITNAIGSREFIFYISVSNKRASLFEKQILSVFPNAKIAESKDDYNIFNQKGETVGSYAVLEGTPAKPIRTYDNFTNDPLKVILNVFSKLDQEGEGAAIQLVFKPVDGFYVKEYTKALKKLEKGEKAYDEMNARNTFGNKLARGFSKLISGSSNKSTKPGEEERPKEIDSVLVEAVRNKIGAPIVSTNIRVIASSSLTERSEAIFSDLKSAFNQFENTQGNRFKFSKLNNFQMKKMFRQFSFREFEPAFDTPMNLKEIATVMHLPKIKNDLSPQFKTSRSSTAPAPLDIGQEGILLGTNNHRNTLTDIYFSPQDRMRHFYVIGQTGTGKTNLLKNMIIQDIQNGEGVCMIDPHGSDIQDVLASVPPERYEDVIYFDPANVERPMALNMLEYDPRFPEQKTFVVNELFSIFQKLYGSVPESMGPMFEQYFRNATMLVIEDPESGATLLDVSRVMADKSFRDLKLSKCKNPIVKQFWEEVAEKAGGEAALANIVPYITSKFDVFLANDIMRPIIAQEKSSFNFRKIMDEKKILLINLSKGRLGDINSNLIGLIVVGKILMASLSRVDQLNQDLNPFYLYIDEFQNVTTDSISTILSEARKYKLSLNIAHQFIAQLNESIKDSVFGNVGSMAVFRVGSDDAKFLESQFDPIFNAHDIMNIENYNCYLKILVNGVPVKPFNLLATKSPEGDHGKIENLKELSRLKYGSDKNEVDVAIMKKYEKPKVEDPLSKFDKFNI